MYLNPQFIKTLPPNVDGRDFVIGDLHGCYDEVEQLLSFVNFNTTFDRLFSTGDLIDRGPKSIECLSLLRKPWFYAILGNHEELALNKIKSLRLGQIKNISPIELDYLARIEDFLHELTELPLAYEIEHILFDKAYIVHAEILPEHLFDVNPEQLNTQEYDKYFDSLQKYDLSQSINKFFQDYKENELNGECIKYYNSGKVKEKSSFKALLSKLKSISHSIFSSFKAEKIEPKKCPVSSKRYLIALFSYFQTVLK